MSDLSRDVIGGRSPLDGTPHSALYGVHRVTPLSGPDNPFQYPGRGGPQGRPYLIERSRSRQSEELAPGSRSDSPAPEAVPDWRALFNTCNVRRDGEGTGDGLHVRTSHNMSDEGNEPKVELVFDSDSEDASGDPLGDGGAVETSLEQLVTHARMMTHITRLPGVIAKAKKLRDDIVSLAVPVHELYEHTKTKPDDRVLLNNLQSAAETVNSVAGRLEAMGIERRIQHVKDTLCPQGSGLTCPVCMDGSDRWVVTAVCGHLVCMSCKDRVWGRANGVACPTCRSHTGYQRLYI